jgi:hypothetical protein
MAAMSACPRCGSKDAVPIVYGLPTEESIRKEAEGKYILGGCEIISGLSPALYCKKCGNEWGDVQV